MTDTQALSPAPSAADPFVGQILDGDGHMYMHVDMLREVAGELDGGFMVSSSTSIPGARPSRQSRPQPRRAVECEGYRCLGAYDAAERIDALDAMGVRASWCSTTPPAASCGSTRKPHAMPAGVQ